MAKYFQTMQGSYEVRACAAGRTGQCLQQVAPVQPINWQDDSDAYTLVGDPPGPTTPSAPTSTMQQAGTVTLLGRANTQNRPQTTRPPTSCASADTGAWSIASNSSSGVLDHPGVRHPARRWA